MKIHLPPWINYVSLSWHSARYWYKGSIWLGSRDSPPPSTQKLTKHHTLTPKIPAEGSVFLKPRYIMLKITKINPGMMKIIIEIPKPVKHLVIYLKMKDVPKKLGHMVFRLPDNKHWDMLFWHQPKNVVTCYSDTCLNIGIC